MREPIIESTDFQSFAGKVRVVVPTLNAAKEWPMFSSGLRGNISPADVLIIDSSSSDRTRDLARADGFQLETIAREEFNHGATRQLGVEFFADADVIVFLTQDAELASHQAIARLCGAFTDERVGAAYGRQLPRREAGAIEAHARLFNYPPLSQVRSFESRRILGFKSVFFSNSFGAYRRSALQAVGGFPDDVIFGEDTVTVAKLLMAGWKLAYVAEAEVYHSHAYRISQEFSRYFDIGVLHSRAVATLAPFGTVRDDGKKFVKSELAFLREHDPRAMASALIRTGAKFLGYRLGRVEQLIPTFAKRRLSGSRSFWKSKRTA